MKANVYDNGRVPNVPQRNAPVNAGAAAWLVPVALILLSALPIAGGIFRLTQMTGGTPITPANERFFASPLPVLLHIISVSLYAILGSFQFVPALRRPHSSWHRIVGRILIPAGLMVALTGLWMTLFYPWPAGDGVLLYRFRLMFGSAMLVFILLGVAALRRRDFARHGDWMLRGYAVGIGAGTQALLLMVGEMIAGKPSELSRALLMGAAWVINLAVAEWIIRRRSVPSARMGAPPRPLPLVRRIALHWVVRLLMTWFGFGVMTAIVVAGLEALGIDLTPTVSTGMLAGAALFTIVVVTRLIERRTLAEVGLSARRLAIDWLKGAAVGAAYLCASVGILAVIGGYHITGVAFAGRSLAGGLLLHVLVGIFEETLFRGILFRFLEEGFGSWVALTLTALFFGLSHLGNPNATLWSAIAIALEAGVTFAAVYMATRSLWFAMGLHTAWNFLQGNVFGVAVSGSGAPTDSLFQPLIQGNPWLTGGAFGIEASVIAVALGLGLGIYFIVHAVQQKRIMRGLLWRGGINVLSNVSQHISLTSAMSDHR
jgi:membrane protease YdiL (CAAX protease family)